jgi:ApeA N-terminal domain 1
VISETPEQRTFSLNLEEKPRLLGTSTDGKPITLEGLWEAGQEIHFPGLPTADYRARVTLVGKHFPADERVAFDEIAIGASDLNAWTRVHGFATSIETEPFDDDGHVAFVGAEVRYEAPGDIHIPLAGGEELVLRFSCQSKGLGARSAKVELRQEATLHWRFSKPVDLASVFSRVGQIRNFLSLAVGRPVSITSVTGFQDAYKLERVDAPRPIEIYWEIPHNPDPPESERDPREMLFTLTEAEPDASTVIKRWLARQDRLEPVFNLYFGTLYHPSLYLEVRFLAFAQALETYDFRRRRKPARRTLAERTHDVLRQCRGVSGRIVGADPDAFVTDFKNARNYYTHYDPRLKKKAADGAALLLLTVQLQAILEMSLLRQLGFPCRAVAQILERGDRFSEIGHLRREAGAW